ncbi:MAG: hypothetical protein JWM21_244 [Acidobacteria bacterium]|nr:hypothetical protein [Acidobacteriota bacterium]
MLTSPVTEEDEIDALLANVCVAELLNCRRGIGILPMLPQASFNEKDITQHTHGQDARATAITGETPVPAWHRHPADVSAGFIQ